MADILLYNAFAKASLSLRSEIGEPATLNAFLAGDPERSASWPTLIPKLNTANALCVYDTSPLFRSGACCLWTVPAGATKVRFELWGAGSGSGAPICCGHYPWGPSGAYASVIIDATVGCQYTLCAGCAHCCNLCCGAANDVSGCKSFVTGHRLTNFCAEGGCGQYCTVMCYANPAQPLYNCRYQGRGNCVAGMCICSGWSMCFSNSCASCGVLPRAFVPTRTFYGTATGGTVVGFPSMASADCFDTNNYGCICSTMTLLPNGTVSTIYCDSYDSANCCGPRCAGCVGRQVPGLGGIWTHAMGGGTGICGDWGRTGMVKVSWC